MNRDPKDSGWGCQEAGGVPRDSKQAGRWRGQEMSPEGCRGGGIHREGLCRTLAFPLRTRGAGREPPQGNSSFTETCSLPVLEPVSLPAQHFPILTQTCPVHPRPTQHQVFHIPLWEKPPHTTLEPENQEEGGL